MIEFHNTRRGQTYFDVTLPRLVKVLGRIADSLEKGLANLEKYEGKENERDREKRETDSDKPSQ